ncbi:Uncharacterized zinc protease-like protein y4wB [Coccomyxa sp. Obi]|nr:Uncharacterized zinc protease-like protein y4wB [Coccomyxa sp. Obi]
MTNLAGPGMAGFLLSSMVALTPSHALGASLDQGQAQVLPPIPTQFPELGDLRLPLNEKVVLRNGLRVFLVQDPDVPLVKGTLLFRGGLRASPADKVGIASISAGVQRAGGSVAHPGAVLDEALEQRAALIEGGAGPESSSLGFECLAEDTEEVVGLFSEVLMSPALPEDKLALYKSQVLNVLEHLYDNPGAAPRRLLARLLYGRESVFARIPTPDQVTSITSADVASHLATWQRPDAAVLGIAGDFDFASMKAVLERQLGGWRPAAGQPEAPPPVPNTPLADFHPEPASVYLVDRPGLTQASVLMGEPGISLADPDSYALDVLGDILNSFGGRLFDQIRSREGLTYSVSGGWDSPIDHPGLFAAGGSTARPAEFLDQLQRVLKEATEVLPTEEEIASAKAETLNSFIFNFASTNAQMQRTVIYALLGLPEDYLFTYKSGIEAVTAEDVLGAAQRHLHPDQQTVVIAADASAVQEKLEARGRRVIPMTLD